MRCDEVFRKKWVPCLKRSAKKKKKARGKASKVLPIGRPTLLLHKLRGSHGRSIRKKICTVCKENKWLSEFYISRNSRGGPAYKSECKKCDNARNARLKKRKKDKENSLPDRSKLAYSREYYHSNRPKFAEYRKQFLAKNPDYFRIKSIEKCAKIKKLKQDAEGALYDRDCL